jgi:hypothetical protein
MPTINQLVRNPRRRPRKRSASRAVQGRALVLWGGVRIPSGRLRIAQSPDIADRACLRAPQPESRHQLATGVPHVTQVALFLTCVPWTRIVFFHQAAWPPASGLFA